MFHLVDILDEVVMRHLAGLCHSRSMTPVGWLYTGLGGEVQQLQNYAWIGDVVLLAGDCGEAVEDHSAVYTSPLLM